MIGIVFYNLIVLAFMLFILRKLPFRYVLVILSVILACLNIRFAPFSLVEYLYALLDTPSVMSVLFASYYIAVFALRNRKITHKPPLSLGVQILYVLFGLYLYLSALGIAFVDIYFIDCPIKLVILCGFAFVLYLCNHLAGYMLLIALVCYMARLLGEIDVMSYCIDVLLWAYCVCGVIWHITKNTMHAKHPNNLL